MAESSTMTAARGGQARERASWVVEMGKLLEQTNPSMEMARWEHIPPKNKSRALLGRGERKNMAESSTMTAARGGQARERASWVVEMGKLLEQTNPSMEMARWEQHCIYRVPEVIKDRTNRKAYQPQFLSLGPYHHGEPHLLAMEEHKRRAVLHLVKRSGKPLERFVEAIEEVADEVEGAYDDLDDKWRGANRGSFVEMLLADGCFLLELLRTRHNVIFHGGTDQDYAANDPIFGKDRYHSFCAMLRTDMIRMENQVPLVVLQRLLAVQHLRPTATSARFINGMVLGFLHGPCLVEDMDSLGLHFLDIFHKSYCGSCPHWEGSVNCDCKLQTPCAVELSEAGIQFKKSNTESIHGVEFENGVLSMPLFIFHDSTEIILLNLMAFEWLHPGAKKDVASYVSFVDNIIGSERDAALLRSEGIIVNKTGSDKKVVEVFNTLTQLARSDRVGRLAAVKREVNAHYSKRRNRWRASFVHTYLSNPWVFISLVAAVILLIATLLQTVYTIVPLYTKG